MPLQAGKHSEKSDAMMHEGAGGVGGTLRPPDGQSPLAGPPNGVVIGLGMQGPEGVCRVSGGGHIGLGVLPGREGTVICH